MHRPAVALATALLAITAVAGPSVASAAPAQELPVPSTCGTLGPPVCDVVAQVTALLAPLQPALALVGPVLGPLGQSAGTLTAILEAGPDLPPAAVAEAAGAVLRDLHALSDPVLDLLRGAGVGVGPLEAALAQLQGLATAPLAPSSGSGSSAGAQSAGAPAPATTPGSTASSTSASGATGFDGALSSGGAMGPVSSPSVPDVPVGSTLELGALALPSFGLTTTPATSADELAAEVIAADVVAPAVAKALVPELPDGSRATAAVLAFSMLMLAAGLLLDQLRKGRLPLQV